MQVTSVYAALLTALFIALSVRTLRLRRTLSISIGDAGNPQMLRAMRVHSNFAEYVPLGLVILMLVESHGANIWLLHGLGVSLLCGRVVHAYGVSQQKEEFRLRVAGMALTFGMLSVGACLLLLAVLFPSGV